MRSALQPHSRPQGRSTGNVGAAQAQARVCKWLARSKVPRVVGANTGPSSRTTVRALESPSSESQDAQLSLEAFQIATLRLQELLEDASWDSNEAVRAELATYSPGMKLTFLTNCGSLLTLVAFGVSWITGEDPLGGVTMTSSTLDAAMTGAIASIPLVLASVLTRCKPARSAMPVLEDLHATQAALLQPIINGLTTSQLLIAACATTLPTLFLLLPSMHGVASLLSAIASSPGDVIQPVALTAAAPPVDMTTAAVQPANDLAALHVSMAGPEDLYLTHALSANVEAPSLAQVQYNVPSSLQHDVSNTFATEPAWSWKEEATYTPVSAQVNPLADTAAAAPETTDGGAVTAWLRGLTAPAELHQPALLPHGVPDLAQTLREGLMGLLEPSSARIVRNVTREALGLLPAILSGFIAAYTVMRQLAPRRSQVWAIRDALNVSDRYFRLTVSMDRGVTNMTTTKRARTQAKAPTDRRPTETIVFPAEGSAMNAKASSESEAAVSPETVQDRLDLVERLAQSNAEPAPVAVAPSSAPKSAAVSEAFRKVAIVWLLTRRKVCQLAYMLTAMSIIYYAILWEETQDLAAPATAAVISVVTELWLTQQESLAAVARANTQANNN